MNLMVIVAHPNLNNSRSNRILSEKLKKETNILVRNLYEEYPEGTIDVEREQQYLSKTDRIVFQFPFYWYSCPALLKKWFEDVLTFGWAYGPGGDHLKGKEFMIATTTGGTKKTYQAGGRNWFTISEYLKPIQATIMRCHGTFLPPFVTYNAIQGTDDYIEQEAERYIQYIQTPLAELYE